VVERILGKAEVGSSILPGGTIFFSVSRRRGTRCRHESRILGSVILLRNTSEALA
jgi:hypothetical protein